MALVATISANEPRAISIGPVKLVMMTYTAASADVAGTITVPGLSRITNIVVDGLQQTAVPSLSGNVATLAFVDPAATVAGTIMVLGI